MSISGTINDTASLNASVGSVSQVSGSVSSGNELVVTRVSVPGPQGPQGATGSSLNHISQSADVDSTAVANGSILQYRASDQKFVTRTEIITTTGSLVFNCGQF